MGRILKKIWNIITSVLVVLAVLLAIALVGIRLTGIQVYAVLSGSMEPVYPVGSLIYVKQVDCGELEVGDDITYQLNSNTIVTHRIVEILPEEEDPASLCYRVKGVANKTADAVPIPHDQVLGSPVFAIPCLGYVANFIQRPPGLYIAIAAAAVLLLLSFIPSLLSKEEENHSTQDTVGND